MTLPGEGHLNPLLGILSSAVAAGHEVVVATSELYLPEVAAAELPGAPVGPSFRFDRWMDVWPELGRVPPSEQELWWWRTLSRDVTPRFARDVIDLVGRWGADVVIAEYAAAPAAGIVAEIAGVPVVAAAWAVEPGYDTYDGSATGNDAVRAAFGLAPLPTGGLLDPMTAVLTFLPPSWGALDGPPRASTVRVRTPAVGEGSQPPARLLETDRPRVYATLGTIYGSATLFDHIIEAFAAGGWSAFVTVGRRLDPQRFRASPRLLVEQYVPQGAVLPHCDAVVCHGGLGTILGALGQGLPLVVIPLGSDQLLNAARAERLGVASVVAASQASPEALRSAVAEVLGDPRYRHVAALVRREIEDMPTIDAAVALLHGLRRPPSA